NSKELCVLLFCALIEHQLRNLIAARCSRLNVDLLLIELLLEKYWRVDDRLKLFERLTGVKIKTAVAELPGKHVFNAYDDLRKKRDGLAHGLPAAALVVDTEEIRRAVDEAANSFRTFAHLHHTYCAVDSLGMPSK